MDCSDGGVCMLYETCLPVNPSDPLVRSYDRHCVRPCGDCAPGEECLLVETTHSTTYSYDYYGSEEGCYCADSSCPVLDATTAPEIGGLHRWSSIAPLAPGVLSSVTKGEGWTWIAVDGAVWVADDSWAVWRRISWGPATTSDPEFTTLAFAGGRLFVGQGESLWSAEVEPADGTIGAWRAEAAPAPDLTTLTGDGDVLAAAVDSWVLGEPTWYAATVASDGTLGAWYVLGGEDADYASVVGVAHEGALYAGGGVIRKIDLRSGEVLATGNAFPAAASMAVLCDRLFAVDGLGHLVSWPLPDLDATWTEASRLYEHEIRPWVLVSHEGVLVLGNGSALWSTTRTLD